MDNSEVIKLANQKAKGKRPFFLDDPAVERVLSVTMAMATELAVTRERLDTVERLLEQKKSITKKNIDNYVPTDEIAKERQEWQSDYIARILRIFHQEISAAQKNNTEKDTEKDSEKLADYQLEK